MVNLFDLVSSGSDSDSDDSGKSAGNNEISSWSKSNIKEEKTMAEAELEDSSAGEDDFNPFGNSGSEDEGNPSIIFMYPWTITCMLTAKRSLDPIKPPTDQ